MNRPSLATESNPKVKWQNRPRARTNLEWLRAAVGIKDPVGSLVLIGGCNLTDFRLRVAQSQVRGDLMPSFWSHAALVKGVSKNGSFETYEVSLAPRGGFGDVPKNNGVQEASLAAYDDPSWYPNIAWLHFRLRPNALMKPVGADGAEPKGAPRTMTEALSDSVKAFRNRRGMLDMSGMLSEWLGYCWGAAGKTNPLMRNTGIPSSVFVESIFAMLGVDLTPGLDTQSSCPDAIWQTAKWWYGYYESEASLTESALIGRYFIGQPAAAIRLDTDSSRG